MNEGRCSAFFTRDGGFTAKKIAASHQKLIDDGSLTIEGAYARVIRDLPFSSPSAASNIVLGTSTNGRTEWATP
ncbi:DUF4357 domain-containing protein, partial [Arcanobacterium canis]